ncbi:hypothetical protein [Microbacterium atlanticum]|uniref:hypothetical protein n=1 Tax=Microbacterium atlanticum TaxID=2782168 RepID=UPI0018880CCA|nr:hypothetical protein [Microbacterium atlanticum]
MSTPRNCKPVEIPSLPPVPHARAAGSLAHLRGRVLERAGALLHPRAGRGVVHRRLAGHRDERTADRRADRGDADAGPASTFRGATARFVALG